MPISPYLRGLREKIGTDLLLVPTVTGVVFDDVGRILLARHGDAGLWVLPGGHIDPDETPADACARELWEETGLEVEPERIIGVFGGTPEFTWTYRNGDRVSFVMIVFECRLIGGRLRPDHVETTDARFVTMDEAAALDLTPAARFVLDRLDRGDASGFVARAWRP